MPAVVVGTALVVVGEVVAGALVVVGGEVAGTLVVAGVVDVAGALVTGPPLVSASFTEMSYLLLASNQLIRS